MITGFQRSYAYIRSYTQESDVLLSRGKETPPLQTVICGLTHLTVSEASQPHHERTADVTLLQHAAETDTCPAAGALRWEVKTGLQSIPVNLNSGPCECWEPNEVLPVKINHRLSFSEFHIQAINELAMRMIAG